MDFPHFLIMLILLLAACSARQLTQSPATIANAEDEADVRKLVENFGRRFQAVSLLAPEVAQEIRAQYPEFISPTLLAEWTDDLSKAPGRVTSSPWPDHIEITAITGGAAGEFMVTGFIIEFTSVEVVNGGEFDQIPIRMTVQKIQGHWLITEYSQEEQPYNSSYGYLIGHTSRSSNLI
jgi:hypothetical protein